MKIEEDITRFIFRVRYLQKYKKQYLFIHHYNICICQIFNYFLESPSFNKHRKITFNCIIIIINRWYVNCMRLSVFQTKTKWKNFKNPLKEDVRLLKIIFCVSLLDWRFYMIRNFYCTKPWWYAVVVRRTFTNILTV